MRWMTMFLLFSCNENKLVEQEDPDSGDTETGPVDADGDGVAEEDDCDDSDSSVSPDADEICDGIDNNCDGLVDEDDPALTDAQTFYADGDSDGYGRSSDTVSACEAPDGAVAEGRDCDDDDPSVNPGADEICNDGKDNDCDGLPGECSVRGILPLDDAPVIYAPDKATHGTLADLPNTVAAADFDGDGFADLAAGARYANLGTTNQGAVYIFSGPILGTASVEDADTVAYGSDTYAQAGYSIATGDYNGDGRGDLMVGVPYANGAGYYAGEAAILYGPLDESVSLNEADGLLLGESTYDYAGTWVGDVGDLSGDGIPEVAITASGTDTLYLMEGPLYGTYNLAVADTRLVATQGAGQAVTHLDLNNDGHEDIALSTTTDYTTDTYYSGITWIAYGPFDADRDLVKDADATITGASSYDAAGYDLEAADLDGDGTEELLLGAYGDETGGEYSYYGAVFIYQGALSGTLSAPDADYAIVGENYYDYAGISLSTGDINGDGIADLFLGASGNDYGGYNAGAGYLIYGGALESLALAAAPAKLHGQAGDSAGSSVFSGADLDGDGLDDMIVGGETASINKGDGGAVYVVYGDAGI